MRNVSLSILDQVKIASPCPVRWDDMRGDERVRHCDQCDLKVHNISGMSREEAESFLQASAAAIAAGRRVCAGFWQRADGTIITRDCPVGLAAVRAAVGRRCARIAALLALAFSAVVTLGRGRAEDSRLKEMEPFSGIARALNPVAPLLGPMARPRQVFMLGGICAPRPMQQTPAGGTR